MPDLRLGVLGELEVVRDGRRLAVPPGRRRAVLVRLLLQPGAPVPADALVDAAWGEHLPRDPHAALHTVVSRLRSVLGAGVLQAAAGGYRLHLTPGSVDVEEFEELLDRAGSAEPARARALLRRALDLWRGPAYGEQAEAPFAQAAAARLEGLRADALEALATACVDEDDPGAAVALLEPLLEEEPFRERAVELLVTALYRTGRQVESLDRLRRHRALLAEELGLDPAPVLVELESRILGHELPPSAGPPPPVWLDSSTAFVGREDDVADLVEAVRAGRVTVVTGPGGVGKTRLVAEVLPSLRDRHRQPVAVTELAPVVSGGVAAALAESLGIRPRSAAVADEVVEHLAATPHLLVLDNCEHVLDEVGRIVTLLTRRCRGVRVIATSRRRLGLGAERVLPLAPLPVPVRASASPSASGGAAAASVRLVTDRVRRLQPAFAVTEDNVEDVAEVCRRFDGLPLALELAASRIATLGVAEVLSRAPAGLVNEDRAGLGAAVAWSYRLLATEQQELLAAISVFTSDFTADAVRGLTAYLAPRSPDARDGAAAALQELVESSLVAAHVDATGVRYRLLAVVRAFAADRLAEDGRGYETQLAHALWVRDVSAGIADDVNRVDGAAVGARLARAAPEVRAAVRWTLDEGRLEVAAAVADAVTRCLHWTPPLELRDLFVEVAERCRHERGVELAGGLGAGAVILVERGDLEGGRSLAEAAVRRSVDGEALTALVALGVAAMYAGDHDDAARWFRRMIAVPVLGWEGYASLALVACYREDLATARQHAEIALAAGPSGSDAAHAFARYAAGEVLATTDPVRGAVLLAEAADEADRVGAEQVSRVSRIALLALLARDARHGEAVELGGRLLADLRLRGAWVQVWTTLRLLAELLPAVGRAPDAVFVLGAVDAASSAPPLTGQDVPRYAELGARLEEQLGSEVVHEIRRLAAGTPRVEVLARVERLLAGLGAGPPDVPDHR